MCKLFGDLSEIIFGYLDFGSSKNTVENMTLKENPQKLVFEIMHFEIRRPV